MAHLQALKSFYLKQKKHNSNTKRPQAWLSFLFQAPPSYGSGRCGCGGLQAQDSVDGAGTTPMGANGAQMKQTAYDEYINASKGKVQNGKGKGAGKGTTKNWRQPVLTIGSLTVAVTATTAQDIIPGDSQDDAQSVALQSIIHHNVRDRSSRRRRQSSMTKTMHGVSPQGGIVVAVLYLGDRGV